MYQQRNITPLKTVSSPQIQQFSNDPKVWGPHAWIFIHTIAAQYPVRPTTSEKEKFKTFFTILPSILPCVQCGINMMSYIQQNYSAFIHAFDSRQALFKWTVDFHTFVNSKERSDTVPPTRTKLTSPNQPKRSII
jgi:hypothetical protein